MFRKFIQLLGRTWVFIKRKEAMPILNAFYFIADVFSKRTKNKIDDAALAYLATMIRYATKDLSPEQKDELVLAVNNYTSEGLDGVTIGLDPKKGVVLKTKYGEVTYDHESGIIK